MPPPAMATSYRLLIVAAIRPADGVGDEGQECGAGGGGGGEAGVAGWRLGIRHAVLDADRQDGGEGEEVVPGGDLVVAAKEAETEDVLEHEQSGGGKGELARPSDLAAGDAQDVDDGEGEIGQDDECADRFVDGDHRVPPLGEAASACGRRTECWRQGWSDATPRCEKGRVRMPGARRHSESGAICILCPSR